MYNSLNYLLVVSNNIPEDGHKDCNT